MHRIRRRALALLTALVCLMPTHSWASASQDPLLDFIKTVAPDAISEPQPDNNADPAPAATEPAADTRPEAKPRVDDSDLAASIAQRWKRSPQLIQEILGYVREFAYQDFPRSEHLLAVMAVESSFDPKARNRGNVGLMQINIAANGRKLRNRGMRENVRVGSELLREYYLLLRRDQRATLLSYNAGIGNYRKGRYRSMYWRKYQQELTRIRLKH